MLYDQRPDVVILSETWLNGSVPDALLDPEGLYRIFRRDRSVGRGGGVCIIVSRRHNAIEVATINLCPSEVECVGVDVSAFGTKLRFIGAYRPPGYSKAMVTLTSKLQAQLINLCNVKQPVFIAGDLNCPDINWETFEAPNDSVQNVLLDFVCITGLTQLVTQPTCNRNILDLILTNEPLIVSDLHVDIPLASSDHNSINFELSLTHNGCEYTCSDNSSHTLKKYLWQKADYESISALLLNVDWSAFMTTHLDPDSVWNGFCDILESAFTQFVPAKETVTADFHSTTIKRFPAYINRLICRKRCLWRLMHADPDNTVIAEQYRNVANICRRSIRDYAARKEIKLIDSANLGMFYKYVNSKMACKSGIGSLKAADGTLLTSDTAKAELLNEYFVSVCTTDNGTLPVIDFGVPEEVQLDTVHFSPHAVMRAIARIKPSTSPGPDGLPASVLRKLAPCISSPLSAMFSSFLSVGKVPSQWKTAIVTPVYKKGISSDCANYRPISLTCVVCKIMERIIACEVLAYARKNKLLSKSQHGFLSRRSTATNLLECLNDWTVSIKHKFSSDIIYIDYAKAFDSVCHNKLICKLSALGIRGSLLDWIKSFLSDRRQVTRVGQFYSSSRPITSGVVQGSCIGPLLFVLYINDLTNVLGDAVECKLFADDVKLYTAIRTSADQTRLQEALDRVVLWSDSWQLNISAKKCAKLTVGSHTLSMHKDYSLCGKKVSNVREYQDLGITIDQGLKFKTHIHTVVAKARQRASLILKCFSSRDPNLLMRAFSVYVRPILEYASCTWSPTAVGLIDLLESVQRRFTKCLTGCRTLGYRDRLKFLNIESLEVRRLRLDLVLTYKIIFGMTDFECSKIFTLNKNSTRGHQYKILPEHGVFDIRRNYFSCRVVRVWNGLPPSVVCFNSLSSFKRSLDDVALQLFTRF